MIRTLFVSGALACLAADLRGQSPNPFKSYRTQEEYCQDNPTMPTCIDGRPIDIQKGLSGTLYKAPVARPRAQPEAAPVAPIPLQDWRFSHSSPAMLMSINIGSLLRSPLLTAWISAAGIAPADLEKARAALSDAGQVLISITANGTASPSVLLLVKGNVDGALGAMLRSDPDLQAKRLDAITMLIGDAHSVALAGLRMRGTAPRTTMNRLQQAATTEALKYDAWIGIDPAQLASVASLLGTPNSLGNLRGLSAGLYLRDQIRLEAALDAPSADAAERMRAAMQKGEQVWVSTEGPKVRYVQIVDGGHLKSLSGFETAGARIAPLIRALAAASPAAAPAPKQSGAVVIQGFTR